MHSNQLQEIIPSSQWYRGCSGTRDMGFGTFIAIQESPSSEKGCLRNYRFLMMQIIEHKGGPRQGYRGSDAASSSDH